MDYFWHHLAEASEIYDIRLTREIPSNGLCLKAGELLDRDKINTLSTSVDADGIEQSVKASPSYSSSVFKQDLNALLNKVPDFDALFDPFSKSHYFKVGAEIVDLHPRIAFRLHILKASLASEYQRTLFCVAWSMLDSHEIDRSDKKLTELLLVCLTHDLGLLDIERQLGREDHDHRFDLTESFEYHRHVDHSVDFLKTCGESVSRDVIQGVSQHHERMDGTGFPSGMAGIHLNELGQIVHLYDSMYSIYQKYLKPLNKSLADLRPVIEVSAVTHYGAPATRAIVILEKISRKKSVYFKDVDYQRITRDVSMKTAYVEKSLAVIQSFTNEVGFRHEDRRLFALQNSFIHIALAHHKMSTRLQESVKSELEAGDQAHLQSSQLLEESYVVLREIIFHIGEFKDRLSKYNEDISPDSTLGYSVRNAVEKLRDLQLKLSHSNALPRA